MELIGSLLPWGTGGSWIFQYGDINAGTLERESFLVSEYGTSAKAKAAALKYQKLQQPRLEKVHIPAITAKSHGFSYDEWIKKPTAERQLIISTKFQDEARKIKRAAGGYEQTFTYKNKTYTIPTKFPEDQIPKLKKFLKSFKDWKAKGSNIQAYSTLKGRGPAFDNTEGDVWRRLIKYAKGEAPLGAGKTGTGALYKTIFDELKLPKKDLDIIKNFDKQSVWAVQAARAGLKGAEAHVADPLIEPILNFLKKNPGATETELFSAIRKTAGKNLTNGEITTAAVRAHANGASKLLMEARKEPLGEFRFKELRNITSLQLEKALGSLYAIFPNQIFRDFSGTVREFYKDNPTLRKRALDKLKAYGEIRVKIATELGIGKPGRGGAAFQFDHPISFKALKKGGDLAGAIRTNPIAGDVNQFKGALDKKLNEFQKNIIKGTNVEGNLKKIDTLKNINKTLFGKLAGDFTIDATGKIKVLDYGAKAVLDPTYNIAKSLEANLPLGQQIKKTIGGIKPQLTEVLGETGAKTFMAEAAKLKTFFNSETHTVQRHIANALDCGRAEGGRIGYALGTATINCVNTKLTNEPVQSSMRLRVAEGVGKIKPAATSFLKMLGRGGVKAAPFAAVAALGAVAEPLVKQFRNDDYSTYLSDPEQQGSMLLAMVEAETPKVDEEILKWQYPGMIGGAAAAIPGSSAVYKARRKPFKTRAAMGVPRAALGPVGKFLAGSFSPLGVAASLPISVAAQVKGGSEIEDIATDPFNWMGPAFASAGARMATRGMPQTGILAKAIRMGMSPGALRVLSRAGIYGLAASAGLTGYDWWKNRGKDKDDEFKVRTYKDDDD
jgi:hypothetical protein